LERDAHFAVETAIAPIGRFVQAICLPFAHYVNSRQGQSGKVFPSRYRAILVARVLYLCDLVVRIHLLPVEQGLAKGPGGYFWSTHRAYDGQNSIPWLTIESVFDELAIPGTPAVDAYRRRLAQGVDRQTAALLDHGSATDPRTANGVIPAEWRARKRADRYAASLDEIANVAVSTLRMSREDVYSPECRAAAVARALTAWHWVRAGGTLVDVARLFGVDPSTLLDGIERYRETDLFKRPLTQPLERIREVHRQRARSENVRRSPKSDHWWRNQK
jgi:transposase-like protein